MTLFQIACKNILRDKHSYVAYFLCCTFTVLIFFLFLIAAMHPELSAISEGSSLSLALWVGNVTIYLFAFVFIGYSAISFIKARGQQLATLVLLGTSKKQMSRMLYGENLLIGAAAVICGLLLGLILSGIFLKLVRNILGGGMFYMYFPVGAMTVTAGLFGVLFLMVALCAPKAVNHRRLSHLLKSHQNYGQELCFSWKVAAVAGVGLVGIALLVTVFTEKQIGSEFWIGAMGICVSVVIYGLITQASALAIGAFLKSPRYLQGTGMLGVRELSAGIRERRQVLFITCLLMTAAFFAVIMLGSVQANVKSEVEKIMPFSYIYAERQGNDHAQEDIGFLDQTLLQDGENVKCQYTVYYGESREAMISQTSYNRIAGCLKWKPIRLEDGGILCLRGSKDQEPMSISKGMKETMEKVGFQWQMVGSRNQIINMTGSYRQVYVVSDAAAKSLFQQEGLLSEKLTAYQVPRWAEKAEQSETLQNYFDQSDASSEQFDRSYALYNKGQYLKTDQLSANLMAFVGTTISIIFLVAASSVIYFSLYTTLDREKNKYKNIQKLGFSQRELKKVIGTQMKVLLFVPFVIAMIVMWLGVLYAGTVATVFNIQFAAVLTVVFALLEVVLYQVVYRVYLNRVRGCWEIGS